MAPARPQAARRQAARLRAEVLALAPPAERAPQGRRDHQGRCAPSSPTRSAASSTATAGSCWWPPSCRPSAPTRASTRSRPGLFGQFPTPADFAAAPIEEIEEAIRSTGFFRNKAKSLQGAARALIEKHGGRLPEEHRRAGQGARLRAQDRQRGAGRGVREAGGRGRRHPCGAHLAQAGTDRPGRPGQGRSAS